MAAIDPLPLDPPPNESGFDGTVTQLKTNLTTNLETIVQTPADAVKGVKDAIHSVDGWFSDPVAPAPGTDVVLGPSEQSTVPAQDPPAVFTGPGKVPTWEDVFNWYAVTTHAQTTDLPVPSPVSGLSVQHAIDVANGQTIKALSGSINQVLNLATLASDVLGQRITDTQTVIGALNNNQALTNTQLHNILDLVVNDALPQLRTMVEDTQKQILNEAAGVIKLMQVWATDNIFKPLEEDLANEKALRIAEVDQVIQNVPGMVKEYVDGLGLVTAASFLPIAATVLALQTEADDCVEPMCEQFGPGSQLSNLLKSLLDSGLLALLAGLAFADPTLVEKAALLFARETGPTIESAISGWLVPLQADTADA